LNVLFFYFKLLTNKKRTGFIFAAILLSNTLWRFFYFDKNIKTHPPKGIERPRLALT